MTSRPNKPTKRGVPPPGDVPEDDPTRVHGGASQQGATPPKNTTHPIKAISMKTPTQPGAADKEFDERDLPHVRLRRLSEVSRVQQAQNLGNLAPPYDPAAARNRTVKEYLVWASVAVILGCAIALVVWFAAT